MLLGRLAYCTALAVSATSCGYGIALTTPAPPSDPGSPSMSAAVSESRRSPVPTSAAPTPSRTAAPTQASAFQTAPRTSQPIIPTPSPTVAVNPFLATTNPFLASPTTAYRLSIPPAPTPSPILVATGTPFRLVPPPTATPAPVRVAPSLYLSPGGGHWVSSRIDSGKFILLEDRSLWEIDSLDRLDTMLWLIIDSITVVESNSCLYGYRLVNTSEKTAACARFLSYSR